MSRFMISLEQAVNLVWHAFDDMRGGEIYVKKIPSMNILDIATAVSPESSHHIIGIRPGEKLHEQMIGVEDAPYTFEYKDYYKILPMINDLYADKNRIKDGIKVADDFSYVSNTNTDWMSIPQLKSGYLAPVFLVMTRKVVAFAGGSGLLATNLSLLMAKDYKVYSFLHKRNILLKNVTTLYVNLDSIPEIEHYLLDLKVDILINCAALTNVETCEKDPNIALHINSTIANNMAIACSQIGVKLVHISTDHLFDGISSYYRGFTS